MVTDGNTPWCAMASGVLPGTKWVNADSGTALPVGTVHVYVLQGLRRLPVLRRDLHHHVILIQRRIHGRDRRLPEGIVQCRVNLRGREAEPRSRIAIHDDR